MGHENPSPLDKVLDDSSITSIVADTEIAAVKSILKYIE